MPKIRNLESPPRAISQSNPVPVMSTIYKSKSNAAIHETASDLYEGCLMDERTMKEFDKSCLTRNSS